MPAAKLATQAQLVEVFGGKNRGYGLSSAYERQKAKSTELGRVLAQNKRQPKTNGRISAGTLGASQLDGDKAAAADLQQLRNELSATGVNLAALGSQIRQNLHDRPEQ